MKQFTNQRLLCNFSKNNTTCGTNRKHQALLAKSLKITCLIISASSQITRLNVAALHNVVKKQQPHSHTWVRINESKYLFYKLKK